MSIPSAARASEPARLDRDTMLALLLAGGMGTIAADFLGQSLSPMLGFESFAAAPLANAMIEAMAGVPYPPGAYLLHYLAGLVLYPLVWLLLAWPFVQWMLPGLLRWQAAILYGVALWGFALYVVGHLLTGLPPFLRFDGQAWVALAGQVLYALVLAALLGSRQRR